MFHMFGSVISLVVAAGVTLFGYWQSRQFVQNRLRYVDAVHKSAVPILAGIGAALIALPIVALLPLVGTGTALLFGAGVATGVSSGRREIRRRIGA
ncbi:MAG TPA: hypothetical protein VHB25_07170 [Gemmatimonadaceae bacterium]|nr:hypothetical protein [Gemmatimonadaceae bacterium]